MERDVEDLNDKKAEFQMGLDQEEELIEKI